MTNRLPFSCSAFVLLVCSSLLLAACDSPTGVEPVDVELEVRFSQEYGGEPATGTEVTLTNVESQESYNDTVNDNGLISFQDVPAGSYDVEASLTYTASEFQDRFGTLPESDEVSFNASQRTVQIAEGVELPALELTAGSFGNLVFKQVYYAGSDPLEGALFRDQFIEIHNNSSETEYLDGLYIMSAYGNNNPDRDEFVQPNGQFDWNQSIGMPSTIDANEDYIYTRWLYQIPGSGQEYPLEPGESVVIAQTAVNHKAPFEGNDGDVIEVEDPSLTVDLSDADFEVYLGDELDRPLASDLDNPSVPNMIPYYIFGTDLIMDTSGRVGYAMFRSDTPADELPRYPSPISREIRDNTTTYIQVPTDLVIDAVQVQPAPNDQVPPDLQDDLDAGFAFVPGGRFSSNSIIRKEGRQLGDRTVLQDTNNSSDDFTSLDRAEPRIDAPQN